MPKKDARRPKRSAFTLITALAFTLVVGTILAGVGTVATSHFSRSKVEGTYANAVALAEAGINFEIAWISRDTANTTLPHQASAPHTGTVDGISGSYQVYVKPWGSNCDGVGDWSAPSDMCVVSTGTVNGISRTVQVRGIRKSVFDEYAIFAVSPNPNSGTFSGGGASSGSTEIVGNMGSNGGLTFNGTLGTDIVNGDLSLNGGTSNSSDSGSNLYNYPDRVEFPTVAEVAAATFPGGLTYLQANNSNANIKRLSSTDTSLASEPTVAGLTLADVNLKLSSAGFTASSRTFDDAPNTVPSDTSSLDSAGSASSSWRFVTPADTTYGISAYGIQGKRIYFVPPGDYYFNNLDFKGGTSAIVMLTHLGRIRFWVDQPSSGAVKQDNLSVPVIFTDTTPSKFRVFYNKCSQIHIGGSSKFNGGFYAVKDGCSANEPMMDFTGNSMIYGSVITQYFTVTGGTKVVFPNDGGGSDPTDFSLWFGFKDQWKEISKNANPVFNDGTSN